jgi:hypothetical protein
MAWEELMSEASIQLYVALPFISTRADFSQYG